MANYELNLKLALDGAEKAAKKIKELRKNTKELDKDINRFNRAVDKRMGKKKGEGSFVFSFKNLSKEVNTARNALNKAAIGTEEFNKAVKNVVEVEETFNKELKKRDRALRVQRIAKQKNISLDKAELELKKQLSAAEDKLSRKQRNKRFGQTVSSAAIGGAFPLLFGQTGAAAIGGGLGGAAGGAIGGQFGFALSILGTAIGSAVDKADKFNKSLVELNTRMNTTGSATAITAKEVNNLAKNLNITKEEAFGVLGAFRQFGDGNIAKSMAMIFGTDAGGVDRFAGLDRSAKLAQEIFDSRKQIGNEATKNLLIQNKSVDAAVIELALVKAKVKAEQDAAIARARAVSPFDQLRANTPGLLLRRLTGNMKITDFGDIRAEDLQKKFQEENITLLENYKKGIIEARELLDLLRESQGQFGISGTLNFNAVTDKVKDLQDEMKKLTNPIFQVITLSETMARSFEDSFVGIIRGTMSVGDAFRNMLNLIADEFIRNAARMAANQFQQGLLGLLGNSFGKGFSGTGNVAMNIIGAGQPSLQALTPFGTANQFVGKSSAIGFAADGGRIPGGRPTLVGERGPELFTPGVSGMITPNHALGGSTNVVVNVDASGSSVEGDEQGGRELGRVISAAVQSEILNQKRPGGLLA
mgnify:CR=1 FL=1